MSTLIWPFESSRPWVPMSSMKSRSSASPVRSIRFFFVFPSSTSTTRLERFWIFFSTLLVTMPPPLPRSFSHRATSLSTIAGLGDTMVTFSGSTMPAGSSSPASRRRPVSGLRAICCRWARFARSAPCWYDATVAIGVVWAATATAIRCSTSASHGVGRQGGCRPAGDAGLGRRWAGGVVEQRRGRCRGVGGSGHGALELLHQLEEAVDVVVVDVAEHHPAQRHRLVLAELLEPGSQRVGPGACRPPVDQRVAGLRLGAVVQQQGVAVSVLGSASSSNIASLPSVARRPARRDQAVEALPAPVVHAGGVDVAPPEEDVGRHPGEHPGVVQQARRRPGLEPLQRGERRGDRRVGLGDGRPSGPSVPPPCADPASRSVAWSSSAPTARARSPRSPLNRPNDSTMP